MRLGLLGTGRQGQKFIATAAKLGIPLAWAEKTPRFDADAIILATPADTHLELAIRAIQAGCDVLIEKPMCLTVEDAEAICRTAAEAGATGFVDHTHLYSPAWRALKAEAGPVVYTESMAGGPCPADPVFDWGSHDVAMAIDLMGKPQGSRVQGRSIEIDFAWGRSAIEITEARIPRRFVACGAETHVYDDPMTDPRPLEVLLREFVAALGTGDRRGLDMGRAVTEVLCG